MKYISRSKTDGLSRKLYDELVLPQTALYRKFGYHEGAITAEHKENGKVVGAPTTSLVSSIEYSGGRVLEYEYDKEERITKVTELENGSVVSVTEYTYDSLGQLLTEVVNGTTVNTLTYDGYGNITSKNGVAYSYGNNVWKDLLTAVGDNTITYDAEGNPTSYLGHTLSWEKGRTLKSYDGISFEYNESGIRTVKQTASTKHTYTLDGTKILREYFGGRSIIPMYDSEDNVCGIVYNGESYFFVKNLQGDVTHITNADGEVVAKYSYDAFGKPTTVFDSSGKSIAHYNPFRYRSYYYDTETGLYYLQSRYYDANTGRFVNADEVIYLGESGSIINNNLFLYCENDPNDIIDPSGNYIVYIHGWQDDQPLHAKKNKSLLSQKYTVYLHEVTYTSAFTNIWNNKYLRDGRRAKIDIVIINLHGNGVSSIKYVDFSKLKSRMIDTLLLLSCNSGHEDHRSINAAYKFYKNNSIRQMICCDGEHVRRLSGKYVRHSVKGTGRFKEFLVYDKKRTSRGFILYRKRGQVVVRYSIGNYFSNITKMLNAVGKW